ncbi:MAG: hypothetical protein MJ094_02575 [Saccharofermentans sp.]|nr:hypothetical protein [Saccharofermentans sp.]
MEITFEQIYNYQYDVMKGQKNLLVFFIMAPILIIFGGAMGGIPFAALLLIVLGVICFFRSTKEKSKLKNLKKGNYTIEKDILIKKSTKRHRRSNSGYGTVAWYIQTQKVYPTRGEVFSSVYDTLEEGDEIAIVKAGGKLITVYSLRTNTLSPELYAKVVN